MTRKRVNAIEKRSLYSQNVFCYFFLILWRVPYRGEFSVFPVGRGNLKTAANPGETFTQSCAENYKFVCTLPHEIGLSITKVMNHFSYL